MINLVPPEAKEDIAYARRNRTLLTWACATFAGLCGIAIVVIAGLLYIQQSTTVYARQVERTKENLKAQKLEETQARIESIGTSMKLTLQVLSREILFSKLLQGIGAVIPQGAALQNLSIGKVDGALDLQVVATDYTTATQVQVNLQDPKNKLFEKADLISISCNTGSSQTTTQTQPDPTANRYPCQVNIRALFAKDNPYIFKAPK